MKLDNSKNPEASLKALFPQPIDCGEGVSVQPFSLATYCLLEKIGSYVIIPHEPDQMEILKTFYICSHEPREVFANIGRLDEVALDWASSVSPRISARITEAILEQILTVRQAMPPAKEGDEKKAVTVG